MTQPTALDPPSVFVRVYRELRRRRVLRTAALYVVASWLCLQVADVLFPAFGIPETAIQVLVWTATIGFPVALVFGWFFDIGAGGIRRTQPAAAGEIAEARPLASSDYLILAAFLGVAGVLLYSAVQDVREAQPTTESTLDLEAAISPPTGASPKLENSIAVLPFTNISSDPENDYFCDGVSEEILHELSGFRELNVIGRTSSFVFKNSDYGVPRISGLLGVRYVLQGSVRKQGDQLRIAAQLLDQQGVQVWSERFDRQLANVFEIQSEIATMVARNVATQLAAKSGVRHLPPIEAYDLFLRARTLLHQREWLEPIALLERVIEIDDRFAEAHAEMAIAHLVGGAAEDFRARARASIDRALELEPQLLRAREAEGLWFLSQAPPDPASAERVLQPVVELDPNSSDALLWLSNALSMQGRGDEARRILERAARIDPLHPSITSNLAAAMVADGEVDAAIELVRRQRELPDVANVAMFRLAVMLRQLGRLVELNEHAKFMILRGQSLGYPLLAHCYRMLGMWPQAAYWFEEASRNLPQFPESIYLASVRETGHERLALEAFRRILAKTGRPLSEQSVDVRVWYGALLSRVGDYAEAIAILEPIIDPEDGPYVSGGLFELDGLHALAWAYLRSGAETRAEQLLAPRQRRCARRDELARRYDGIEIHGCAVNALLGRDIERALDTLGTAVERGWRGYYVQQQDPYWIELENDVQYRALMAQVKADVDRQRAQVERVDAAEDFNGKLAALRAAQ